MQNNKIDILSITESWIHSEIEDAEINTKGYKIFRKDRQEARGGRVLLYVKKSLITYRVGVNNIICEALWIEVDRRRKN